MMGSVLIPNDFLTRASRDTERPWHVSACDRRGGFYRSTIPVRGCHRVSETAGPPPQSWCIKYPTCTGHSS